MLQAKVTTDMLDFIILTQKEILSKYTLYIFILTQASYKVSYFLTAVEERMVLRHYEYVLKDFCNRFQPPMPKYVSVSKTHIILID